MKKSHDTPTPQQNDSAEKASTSPPRPVRDFIMALPRPEMMRSKRESAKAFIMGLHRDFAEEVAMR